MLRRLLAVFLILASLWVPAFAVQPDEMLDDPALEQRARQLSAQMRCMVCQNQSIDDSDAPLAKDLRVLIRDRLVAGDSNDQVVNYLVSRYGEFVLLKPRLTAKTVALWSGPFLIFMLGAFILWRKRRSVAGITVAEAETGLSPEERKKLDSILKDNG
jgi:cytochrome c-type biogenesis protein CcmH